VSVNDLPLLELFTRLRQADLPLGIDEYKLLLNALQGGFGISDSASLRRLCRALWVKSIDDGRLFDYHFEQLMLQPTQGEFPSQPQESALQQSEITSTSTPLPSTRITTPDSPLPKSTETLENPKMTMGIEDEVQVAQAVLQTADPEDGIPFSHFISIDEYFPVTRRQMKQSWRYLRQAVREGPPVEVDVNATVNEIGHRGMLLKPVLVPRRRNRAELLLLIDQGGSMAPFHILSHRLAETALRGGRLGKTSIYYFHNCFIEYVYRDPAYQEYKPIEEILGISDYNRTRVLVFSDAGSARGGFNQERADLTEKFLKRLKQRFPYIAWLNPMPHSRWHGTTAEKVMQIVPMFDLSRRGLDDAISVLRGHSSNSESTPRYIENG
jgi:uncharacterized protein